MFKKYQGKPRLITHELEREFKGYDFVFVCDMTDLFGAWVPAEIIKAILLYIEKSPAMFLLLTKNPIRYSEFEIPGNCVCGATIETDINVQLANAPSRSERLVAMIDLTVPRKMLSVEPIMKFTLDFVRKIISIHPEFVAVGMDNYDNKLTEPSLKETLQLIADLEKAGIKVYRKTLREAWNA
jgi:protein gp37